MIEKLNFEHLFLEESPITKNDNEIVSYTPAPLEIIDEESNSLNLEIINQSELSDIKNVKDSFKPKIYS